MPGYDLPVLFTVINLFAVFLIEENKNGTPSLCAAVDSAVGSAQSLLIRSNFVATAMSVHEAEPGTHARHGQGTGKRQRWFKPTAEHAMYTSIMQVRRNINRRFL